MASTETRCTDWVEVAHRREWADSTVAAYRIWQQVDGRYWWQRHEWRHRDGSIHLEDWIVGISGWAVGAKPVAVAA